LTSAKAKVAADKAGLPAADRAAAAGASADDDLRVAQAYMSYGQHAQAVAAAERAVKKGNGKTPGEAQLVLGLAQHKAGNKPAAVKAFKAVKGDPSLERVAKLWALRAQ
jgi:tetratricopeptide (TPR) repeat protein